MCKHSDVSKDPSHMCCKCSRTWSKLQAVGVNMSFLLEHNAFTNSVDELVSDLMHKLLNISCSHIDTSFLEAVFLQDLQE